MYMYAAKPWVIALVVIIPPRLLVSDALDQVPTEMGPPVSDGGIKIIIGLRYRLAFGGKINLYEFIVMESSI